MNSFHGVIKRSLEGFGYLLKKERKFNFFGMNMPFISSSEAKNAYFISGLYV